MLLVTVKPLYGPLDSVRDNPDESER